MRKSRGSKGRPADAKFDGNSKSRLGKILLNQDVPVGILGDPMQPAQSQRSPETPEKSGVFLCLSPATSHAFLWYPVRFDGNVDGDN